MLLLEGSCHCGAVRFGVQSHTPQPYMHCYCSICRKTAGGGGFAINIMGLAETLRITGDGLAIYQAHGAASEPDRPSPDLPSPARRHTCQACGSALFILDPRWPEWVYPFASAIDTPLPTPPERVHIMLADKAAWVRVPDGPGEVHFPAYPDESLEDWHRRHGMYLG
jgi:hypothetical protein